MRKNKLIAIALCMTMCIGLSAGCGGKHEKNISKESSQANDNQATDVNPVGKFPIVDKPITLKIMGRKDPGAPNWDELEIFKRLTKITNIQFEFETSEGDSFTEQKNIALVGGEYPDMIWRDNEAITDEETYGAQGILLDLTELIEKYAPHIKKLFSDRPEVKAAVTALDGKIYGLPYVYETNTMQGHLGFFDSEWMKNVGIDKVPETTDELYTMLKAFKEKDANGNGDPNDEIPFANVGLTSTMPDLLIPAFTGLPKGLDFNVKDGEVIYAPATKEYKDFLTYAHKLYEEGLLDPEFSTETAQQGLAKVKSGICGIYSATPTVFDAKVTKTKQLSLPPLTSPVNDERVVKKPADINPGCAFITDKCKNPEAAMRLLDMFYATEEDAVEGFSGITPFAGFEGEQWEYTDESKEHYRWIAPITSFGDINASISVNMNLPGYLEFMAVPAETPLMENKVEQVKKMQEPYYTDSYPVNVRFTTEESEQANTINNDLSNQVMMMTTKFIIGEEDISKFDSYLESLDKIGLKKLIDIKTAGLKRLNETKKED